MYEPHDLRSRTPGRLAAAEEQLAGTVEAVDRALRELSDARIADLAEDAPPAGKAWHAMTMDEKRSWRAVNEQARRARVAEQQQARDADRAQQDAKRQAAGFGGSIRFGLESSTTADQLAGEITTLWAEATHASRRGRMTLQVIDSAGAREGLRIEASGSAPRIGFLGANATIRPNVTGTRTGTLAQLQTVVANLLSALALLGLVTDSTT